MSKARGRAEKGFGLWLGLLLCLVCNHAWSQVFYRVTSPEGKPSWLLGTLHSADPRLLDFPPALMQALIEAEVLALELIADDQLLQSLEAQTHLGEGTGLNDVVPPALYRRTRCALIARGVSEKRIDRLQPWAAAMLLSQPAGSGRTFMDLELVRIAAAAGARVIALETAEEQLRVFTGLDLALQSELLRHALDTLHRGEEVLEQLIAAHLQGHLEGIAAHAEAQIGNLPETLQQRLRQQGLIRRNRLMAERVQPLIDEGRLFVAVGALHLHGREGLIALLREQGNRVDGVY